MRSTTMKYVKVNGGMTISEFLFHQTINYFRQLMVIPQQARENFSNTKYEADLKI